MQSHSHVLKFSVCTLKKNTSSSNMTSSPPSFRAIITPFQKCKNHGSILQVRAQSYEDEGRPGNMVDGNLRILKERIEEVRNKERLERCICIKNEQGWNYAPGYNHKYKRETMLTRCFDLVGLIGGTVGLTVLGGSFLICLISLILHLNQ